MKINNFECINKLINFFSEFNIAAENVQYEFNNLINDEYIVERYYNLIKYLEKDENKIFYESKYNPEKWLDIFFNDVIDLDIFKKVFGDDCMIPIGGRNNHLIIRAKRSKEVLENINIFRDKINVSRLSESKEFNWTEENIDLGIKLKIWNWELLSKNIALPWSFEFIEKYKKFLDWKYVKANKYLIWDLEKITKYQNYIFLSKTLKYNEFTWATSDYSKAIIETKKNYSLETNFNVKWTNSLIRKYESYLDLDSLIFNGSVVIDDEFVELFEDKINFKSLSSLNSQRLKITPTTIEKYIDRWDFSVLIKNSNIKLEFSLLEKIKDKIDWNYLIIRKDIFWCNESIEKYSNFIFGANNEVERKKREGSFIDYQGYCNRINHSGYFESNENVEWTDNLIYKYADKWKWSILLRNPKIIISHELLEKVKHFIDWDSFFKYGNTDWTEGIIDKYLGNLSYDVDIKLLYGNVNVKWDLQKFEKYVLKYKSKQRPLHLDPFQKERAEIHLKNYGQTLEEKEFNKSLANFCSNAKLNTEIIIKYKHLWKYIVHSSTHKYKLSDFGSYENDTYFSAWECLLNNINIYWDSKLLESCLDEIVLNEINWGSNLYLDVNFIDKYWDFCKHEKVWNIGNYNSGAYSENKIVYLRDFFKYCKIVDLDLKKLKKFEFKWINTLFGSYFINDSIKELIIKEYENMKNNNISYLYKNPKLIKQLLGIEEFEGLRISTIYLSLNSARFLTKNNLLVHEYSNTELEDILTEKTLNYEFLFTGLLNYMIFIEQIGALFNLPIDLIVKHFFPNKFSDEELNSLKQFRNSFAHRFSLATENKGDKSRKFRLNHCSLETEKPIVEACFPWNGTYYSKNDSTSDTIINVRSFINFCEEFYYKVVSENEKDNLLLVIQENEILAKFTIIN